MLSKKKNEGELNEVSNYGLAKLGSAFQSGEGEADAP